ncbi:MAG: alpha/beta fold hydrolase [Bacteriovoracaceae bacterium]|nr:alpha/beta fold hydrolase [Bacteriovoracaceae bacterium]
MKVIINLLGFTLLIYFSLVMLLFFFQEKLIFFPEKLPPSYKFSFATPFEELFITTAPDVTINVLHFKALEPKGVILYFHGNAGSLSNWGDVAQTFVDHGYNVFMPDYRGYGKSTGSGKLSQESLLQDAKFLYEYLLNHLSYKESQITVYGRSLGSGIAAYLAANFKPLRLILETPYYSLKAVAKYHYPWIPSFLLRYPMASNIYIKQVECPIYIFHGTNDEIIHYKIGSKLKPLLKPTDQFITVNGGHHNDLEGFWEYTENLKVILTSM